MQPQVNPGSNAPSARPSGPVVAPAPEREGRKTPKVLIIIILLVIAGGAYWLFRQQEAAEREAGEARLGLRTATVQTGAIERTLRLSGVTAAEKFVSLIAPQIRGSRSGRNRSGFSLAGMDSLSVTALPALGGGSAGGSRAPGATATASSSGSAAAAGAGSMVASTGAGQQRSFGGSGATRAASSRIASSNAGNTRSAGGASTAAGGASASLGTEGLGSTSRELGSGMGGPGGGGGGDFTLVLQQLVKPGSLVKKGDKVAEFDRQYMLQRLEDYKATMETAKAQLAQQKANLELARYTHNQNIEKAKAALEKAKLDMKTLPVLSAIDQERVKLALEEAEAQYKQQVAQGRFIDQQEQAQLKFAELEFKSLELEYRRSEQNADRMLAKANIDGMTVMQSIFRGSEYAQIQQGDQIYPGQFFMQVVDPNTMIINASVNQVDGEKLRIGMKARVRFDAYPGLEVPAHLVSIAAVPKSGGMRANFVREIPVKLKIDRMDPRIIPDLSCSVDVVMEQVEDSTLAPLSAVFRDEATGKSYVYVKNGEAWVRREIEVGPGNYLMVPVKGVSKGDTIALDEPARRNKG